jgi:spermidine synthase
MRFRDRLSNPHAVVFLSSGSIMIMELVASRLIATRLGVSLHTWTSVIGVIMAGISIGNYVGGRLADRGASSRLLGTIFGLASLSSLLILWLNNDLHEFQPPVAIPLLVWVIGYVAGVFLLPSMLLGCISPIVVRLSLKDLQRTGATVGRIYAWSSIGSIFGTFATGFLLISLFGTKNTILLVAGLLMVLALWFSGDAPPRRGLVRVGGWTALFGLSVLLLWRSGYLASECRRESNYFCINVNETKVDDRSVRELLLDRLVHSYSDLDDPTRLVYGYERTYAGAIRPLLERKPAFDAFFIGGGGYTFPRYLEAIAPASHLVVGEIDPEVTEAAHLWLGLSRDTRIEIHNMDARNYLAWHAMPDSYDVVFGDAFNDYSVPFHLTTLEFGQLVDGVLRDDGIYLVNIIDGGPNGHFMRAYVRTMQRVFQYVAIIPSTPKWRETIRTTFVIAASQQPLDLRQIPSDYAVLSAEDLQSYLDIEAPLMLSDDYVPVDNLMAPVVEDSFVHFAFTPDIIERILPRIIAIGASALLGVLALVVWFIYRRRARTARTQREFVGGIDDPIDHSSA